MAGVNLHMIRNYDALVAQIIPSLQKVSKFLKQVDEANGDKDALRKLARPKEVKLLQKFNKDQNECIAQFIKSFNPDYVGTVEEFIEQNQEKYSNLLEDERRDNGEEVVFPPPVKAQYGGNLEEVKDHAELMTVKGVYGLFLGKQHIESLDDFYKSPSLIYVGMAGKGNSSVYARCVMHRASFKQLTTENNTPVSRPGANMKEFINQYEGNVNDIHIYYLQLEDKDTFLAPAFEQYLLDKIKNFKDVIPVCNTAH